MGSLTVPRYLFDTNILIYYFNGEMEDSVADTVAKLMAESFQISVISKMEFDVATLNRKNSKRLSF
jgi:predicted nucleic acid-binding protein